MPKFVKYGNFAPENVPVYLRNSRICLVQHHVTIIFKRYVKGHLAGKNYVAVCLLLSGTYL